VCFTSPASSNEELSAEQLLVRFTDPDARRQQWVFSRLAGVLTQQVAVNRVRDAAGHDLQRALDPDHVSAMEASLLLAGGWSELRLALLIDLRGVGECILDGQHRAAGLGRLVESTHPAAAAFVAQMAPAVPARYLVPNTPLWALVRHAALRTACGTSLTPHAHAAHAHRRQGLGWQKSAVQRCRRRTRRSTGS
jgi:hypothetical protein